MIKMSSFGDNIVIGLTRGQEINQIDRQMFVEYYLSV